MSALRIIEREEKCDEDCVAKQKQTGFLPPGRPKHWREVHLQIAQVVFFIVLFCRFVWQSSRKLLRKRLRATS